ncbi:MAG TPA: hypothetical protein VN025_01995 [Candidatus Dormibacteraeota bacterium]|jgi:hypothetical protein|nr:hypothetical protein [Candidatus Dormibacteraeota bacterium]
MDDFGHHLADESPEMVSEGMTNASTELRKRRSTRIVQAVPLVVTGVDALGRPFVERTSSLIINCHGCRFQSKHYVLKNMWVSLEIPHPESGQAPRSVRGRVAWIQRPRTVRQLFQVALELEIPGNVWGIAFPPEDWFGFDPHAERQITMSLPVENDPEASAALRAEMGVPANEVELPPAAVGMDNVRPFPAPTSTTDASLQLARQLTRLVADAKQQIHSTAHEVVSQLVASEQRDAFEQWEQKFAAARAEVSNEADRAVERIQRETDERTRAAHATAAEGLKNDLPGWVAPQLERVTQELTDRIAQAGTAQMAQQDQRLAELSERVTGLLKQLEETGDRLNQRANETDARLSERVESAARTIEEVARQKEESAGANRENLHAEAGSAREQLQTTVAEAKSALDQHLAERIGGAQTHLQGAADAAAATAQERISASLQEHSNRLVAQLHENLESEAARHSGGIQETAAKASAELEQRLQQLREAAQGQNGQLESAIGLASGTIEQLDQFLPRVASLQQQALNEFQSQLDDVLTLHRNELHRRSESLYEELSTRVNLSFTSAGQDALARFDEQVRAAVEPHVTATNEAVHRLAGGRSLLDAALTLQQDRIRNTADDAFAESLARFRDNLGSVEQLLHDSAQKITTQNLTELESRAADVRHHAVDEMHKSAEWYEKKVQTQIAGLTERAAEHAGNQLREKAGEISSVFASELDHSSRSFVQHTQTQMEEVVREAFDRARTLFAEAADTTSAAFTDEIQRHGRGELDGFSDAVRETASASFAQLQTTRSEIAQQTTADQEEFLQRFRGALSGALETGIGEAREKVHAGFAPLLESWKQMTEAHQAEMLKNYARLGDQAADQYRSRLENVSNSWMVATVTTLDKQVRDMMANIAQEAEAKMRETCSQVFESVGDTIKERLRQLADNQPAKSKDAHA